MKYNDAIAIFLMCIVAVISADKGKPVVGRKNATDLQRQPRMTGGYWAKKGQFPYHASIFVRGTFVCGGGLIHRNYVITAAHCVMDGNLKFNGHHAEVWLGVTQIHSQDQSTRIIAKVEKAYVHREYIRPQKVLWYHGGDIAILKIKDNPAILDKWILKLPTQKVQYAGKTATISGSGVNKKGRKKISWNGLVSNVGQVMDGILRFNKVTVIKNDDCKIRWRRDEFPPNVMCVDTEKGRVGSACPGDSGGPVVLDNVVIGIVSAGSEECDTGIPELLTRVTKYLDFIKKVLANKSDPNIEVYEASQKYTNPFWERGYSYGYIF